MVAASRGLSDGKPAAPAVEGGRRQHPPRLLSVNVAARTIPITTAPTNDDICSTPPENAAKCPMHRQVGNTPFPSRLPPSTRQGPSLMLR
jgi:hypothetical protein